MAMCKVWRLVGTSRSLALKTSQTGGLVVGPPGRELVSCGSKSLLCDQQALILPQTPGWRQGCGQWMHRTILLKMVGYVLGT